ncbi:MAG: YbjN domain-containing protein [Capsulimonadales bacterium]|nr:YbjN domain-containing protein [Capsulimonadales bacterium]
MEFLSDVQRTCYGRVRELMHEIFGQFVMEFADEPVFRLRADSAIVHTAVLPHNNELAVITTWAYVVSGAEISSELMAYLLSENAELNFGAFALDSDGDILLKHTILANTVDPDELKASVLGVALTADRYDDRIITHYGGRTGLETMKAQVEEIKRVISEG